MNSFYPHIPIKRLNPDVPMPKYAHDGDAGMDLCATEDVTLRAGESKKIGCGWAFAIPSGWVGLVFARSGLGTKGLVMKNGTGIIDSTFRGEVQLTLHNNNPSHYWRYGPNDKEKQAVRDAYGYFGDALLGLVDSIKEPVLMENKETIEIHKGDRVAQIVFVPFGSATLQEVEDLDATDRGVGSFGSTGVSTITGGDRL